MASNKIIVDGVISIHALREEGDLVPIFTPSQLS